MIKGVSYDSLGTSEAPVGSLMSIFEVCIFPYFQSAEYNVVAVSLYITKKITL
jgi:hypothetical protein